MIEALMDGTAAMRARGEELLPRWPNEEVIAWQKRRDVSTLYPAFKRTVGVMVGKPFSKQLTPSEDMPEPIAELLPNIDAAGSNLHTFASRLGNEAMAFGFCGVFVDFQRTAGVVETRAQEREVGARPSWVWVHHGQVLGWKSAMVTGVQKLTQLRLAETIEVDDGEFGTKTVKRVRVLYPGRFEIYEQVDQTQNNARDEYVLLPGEGGEMLAAGGKPMEDIPFVPCFGERLGFMNGRSPLLELAFLNVKHWQSQSDQDHILHIARVPLLVAVGVDDDTDITVGSNSAINLSSKDADLKFVEHSGASIGAGKVALDDLVHQMVQSGAELLIVKPGERSATEANNDAEANKSDLQRIAESFEDSLDQCLQYTALWMGLEDGGNVTLFKDFASFNLSDASATIILNLQTAGLISKETVLLEMQRRGFISPDIVPAEELEKASADGPPIALQLLEAKVGQETPEEKAKREDEEQKAAAKGKPPGRPPVGA
jgi:hypothetical protein